MRSRLLAPVALLTVLLAGCGASPTPAAAPAAPPRPAQPVVASQPTHVTKVLTVLLENHGTSATLRGMPRLAALARRYGRTSHYRAITHPSLPNYLALAGGTTAGVHDDASPSRHPVHGSSVFDAALATHHTARTYAEGMPRSCSLTPSGRYAVKHNPWAYFSDATSRRQCAAYDVPSGTTSAGRLHDDVAHGTLPAVGMVVPDLCHDGHDCSLATADAWLDAWTQQVLRGPDWKAGRLALVVTFDEAETYGVNEVLTVVAAPSLSGVVVDGPVSHYSWTRWMADLVGAAPLGGARTAPSLGKAFGL